MGKFITVCFGLVLVLDLTAGNIVKPRCPVNENICEFYLELDNRITMTTMMNNGNISKVNLFPMKFKNSSAPTLLQTCDKFDKYNLSRQWIETATGSFPIGDGSYKPVILFNGSLPGPAIVVYKHQQIVVRVKNKLKDAVTSVHWHGIHQRDTPWMDGVSGLSQCGINPGETFTYRFYPGNSGTYWYHSHAGTQRSMGAYGALIVLERDQEQENVQRVKDPLPTFESDHIMAITDWYRNDSLFLHQMIKYERVSYMNGFTIEEKDCFNSTKQADGVDIGVIPWVSGLVNGKGRYYHRQTDKVENPYIPLETFTVKSGKIHRFRLINAGMLFYLRVAIDQHMLNVIASDAQDMMTYSVESIVIGPGERYDFWIEANQTVGNYWIRVETLEIYQNQQFIESGHTEAILHYEGAPNTDPTSQTTPCSAKQPCSMLNCPYRQYRAGTRYENHTCIPITELESTKNTMLPDSEDIVEHILNFHYSPLGHGWQSTVNGFSHVMPSAPLQTYPAKGSEGITPCTEDRCQDGFCQCTHMLEIPLGKVVQLALAITISPPVGGVLNGNSHSIHLHGQHFKVLKTAYPTYNKTTNFHESKSADLSCDDASCNHLSWSNASWNNGRVPGLQQRDAVLKDSVMVPVGGYVVTRFVADNPGYWYMHCHTEPHAENGMSLIIKVGEPSEMKPAPKALPRCADFDWTAEEFDSLMNDTNNFDPQVGILAVPAPSVGTCDGTFYHIMAIILLCYGILATILMILLATMVHQRRYMGYRFIPSTDE